MGYLGSILYCSTSISGILNLCILRVSIVLAISIHIGIPTIYHIVYCSSHCVIHGVNTHSPYYSGLPLVALNNFYLAIPWIQWE